MSRRNSSEPRWNQNVATPGPRRVVTLGFATRFPRGLLILCAKTVPVAACSSLPVAAWHALALETTRLGFGTARGGVKPSRLYHLVGQAPVVRRAARSPSRDNCPATTRDPHTVWSCRRRLVRHFGRRIRWVFARGPERKISPAPEISLGDCAVE